MNTILYDVLVIGDANVDLVVRGEDIIPDFGQVEKLVDDARIELGGSAAICACGASRLGLKVGFIGKVGDDLFGHFLKNVMAERGIDTTHLLVDSTSKTGVTVHLSRPQDRAMLTFPGTINKFQCDEIDERLFSHARHVHLGSYFLQTALHSGLVDFFSRIRAAGVQISIDPGWDPAGKWNGTLENILDQVEIFLPNDQEAMHITRTKSTIQALKALEKPARIPVIKLGKEGAVSILENGVVSQAGFEVNSIDTTGAGDSFDAGFIYASLHEMGIQDCLRWGCACGALSTTQPGGIDGQPSCEEVHSFLIEQSK